DLVLGAQAPDLGLDLGTVFRLERDRGEGHAHSPRRPGRKSLQRTKGHEESRLVVGGGGRVATTSDGRGEQSLRYNPGRLPPVCAGAIKRCPDKERTMADVPTRPLPEAVDLAAAIEGAHGIYVLRDHSTTRGWNGIRYQTGLSAKNVGAKQLSMNVATIP